MAASTHTNPSLPDLLRGCAGRYPSHTAIYAGERTLDFETFDGLSDRFAAALSDSGIRKGDRVALYCVNSDAFAAAYFGIVKAGAVVVPVNLLLNPKEITYILNDAGAKGMVYFTAFAEAVSAVRETVETLEVFVCIGGAGAAHGDLAWSDLLQGGAAAPEMTFDPTEDLAAIIYTSGTTGHPKGAMLTHRNLAANTNSVQQALKMEPGREVFLVVLPMFHSFAATAGMLSPLLFGCSLAPLPKFDPELVADTIQASGATIFLGVPSMYSTLLRLPDQHLPKFKSLRFCVSGGAAMPAALMEQFEQRFGLPIYEGDGPTECSPVTCCNPIGGRRKLNSVGPSVPDVQMRILDDEGSRLTNGQVGEICVRGPNVMKGYWNLPDATRESFFEDWFRTGDLGYEDDDGYFFIVDRKKDMIIVNGMNVYPRVIEEVLYTFAPVREAAVVGEPSARHGEIPVAYLSLHEGSEASSAEVRAFCRDHLGRHEVPRKVWFMPDLPKNATGKILKRELRRQGELERGVESGDAPSGAR